MAESAPGWSAWFVIDDPEEVGRVWCSHLHKTPMKADACRRQGERRGYRGFKALSSGIAAADDNGQFGDD